MANLFVYSDSKKSKYDYPYVDMSMKFEKFHFEKVISILNPHHHKVDISDDPFSISELKLIIAILQSWHHDEFISLYLDIYL